MLNGIQQMFADLQSNPQMFVIKFLLLVVAVSLHEFGHAIVATSCGDPTPAQQGRVTLNPLAHLDPIGTLGMLFYTFGWGKPVMVSPGFFHQLNCWLNHPPLTTSGYPSPFTSTIRSEKLSM